MSETHASMDDYGAPGLYEIRVKGHLNERWAALFEGMSLTAEAEGTTLLTGQVVDQAALHGLLRKARDLATPLISVRRVKPAPADRPDTNR